METKLDSLTVGVQVTWPRRKPCLNHWTKVKLGDGRIVQAQGKGKVAVDPPQGRRFIHDVFIPRLAQNLLSVAQMMSNGYALSFKNSCCSVFDPQGNLITRIAMINNSFPLNWKRVREKVSFASLDESLIGDSVTLTI